MHVNKKWKERKKMIQKGYEALGMENLKEIKRPTKENNI